ncbi:MAG: DUF4339 domain-containing protein [Planctomycetaceae bacterium]|nr:DUF4339 domain-containing protein [Planctomycetaceae bacterium]
MNGPLYIRVLGRIKGPFEWDKLRTLVKRGQLSRIHEVSADNQTWVKATEYPELFQADPYELHPVAVGNPIYIEPQPEEPVESTAEEPDPGYAVAPPQESSDWYYDLNGDPTGPVTFAVMQQMVASGQIPPQCRVWKEGMDDWAPAETIPGVAAGPQSATGGFAVQPEAPAATHIHVNTGQQPQQQEDPSQYHHQDPRRIGCAVLLPLVLLPSLLGLASLVFHFIS